MKLKLTQDPFEKAWQPTLMSLWSCRKISIHHDPTLTLVELSRCTRSVPSMPTPTIPTEHQKRSNHLGKLERQAITIRTEPEPAASTLLLSLDRHQA